MSTSLSPDSWTNAVIKGLGRDRREDRHAHLLLKAVNDGNQAGWRQGQAGGDLTKVHLAQLHADSGPMGKESY